MNDKISQMKITKSAIIQIKNLSSQKKKNIRFRIYITGGGCNGFQYGFKFEKKINQQDIIIKKSNIEIIIDPISFQYLVGGEIDYIENLNGSKFIIKNPHAKTKCSCGESFSI
ncbi:iron-sulfur cluster insertion protein ErpA [Buchnera aphidicola]|uniref:iron-sulfur cluster insertion protein ErpA n=1 Tax=Buchnera aphidicola TaxID=9 RepID=UPI0034646387